MAKYKNQNGFYAFASQYGLDITTDEGITLSKQKYLAACRRQSKQAIRKRCRSFEVFLEGQEYQSIQQKAGRAGISVTRYIKLAALTCEQVMSPVLLGQVRAQLFLYYQLLEELLEDKQVPEAVTDSILHHMERVETTILHLLHG